MIEDIVVSYLSIQNESDAISRVSQDISVTISLTMLRGIYEPYSSFFMDYGTFESRVNMFRDRLFLRLIENHKCEVDVKSKDKVNKEYHRIRLGQQGNIRFYKESRLEWKSLKWDGTPLCEIDPQGVSHWRFHCITLSAITISTSSPVPYNLHGRETGNNNIIVFLQLNFFSVTYWHGLEGGGDGDFPKRGSVKKFLANFFG